MQDASHEAEATTQQLLALKSETVRLTAVEQGLRTKLQECKAQLEGNEKLIRWLNTQARAALTNVFSKS